ncbi:MAG: DUF5398 family protein [Candidatus Algichlamydia australiensis]|nr:DUF5398 family protein [Chlamydiales bacterium]
MFGMEKGKKKLFEYDIEKLIRKGEAKEVLDQIEEETGKCKKKLREGAKQDEFEAYSTLLHGYTAAKKVCDRIGRK